ncbi:hypothetical protein BDP81DRAFT_429109 [Colletotrichum phormii]|uniref:Uncharacterized protein n=1 Tax=Colletotrichum phormii TaxID=359342 RepID=A0AAJ0EDP6_9PEZI|nr:uncharacterized protein BDP81DRAFT_429109 [Colletotrichum phormii]KAK1636142.1 hypothetical protein BDP81DRAFT_429109 [Colletotrichum phormii]
MTGAVDRGEMTIAENDRGAKSAVCVDLLTWITLRDVWAIGATSTLAFDVWLETLAWLASFPTSKNSGTGRTVRCERYAVTRLKLAMNCRATKFPRALTSASMHEVNTCILEANDSRLEANAWLLEASARRASTHSRRLTCWLVAGGETWITFSLPKSRLWITSGRSLSSMSRVRGRGVRNLSIYLLRRSISSCFFPAIS